MFAEGFRAALAARQEEVNSLVCVGLDPLVEKMPGRLKAMVTHPVAEAEWVLKWMKAIVDATAPYACMFKPQSAHWESIISGTGALRHLIQYIHERHPGIPVFLDAKRGDIGRTQQRYREAAFGILGADGMNFSPYMGFDCMAGLVSDEYPGKALVGLCYTTNPPAREVQDFGETCQRPPLWEHIATRVLAWAKELGVVQDAGLVMAAAYKKTQGGEGDVYVGHLSRCRQLVGDLLWFLAPGFGTQEGFVKATIEAAYRGWGSIALNSSSGIIFASAGDDYAEAAAAQAKELRDAVRMAMPA